MRNKISKIWLYCNHKSVVVGFRNKDCWYKHLLSLSLNVLFASRSLKKKLYHFELLPHTYSVEDLTNYILFPTIILQIRKTNQIFNKYNLTRHWINARLKQNTIEILRFSRIPYIVSINTSFNLRGNYLKWMTWFDHYCVASVCIYSPFSFFCRNI